MKLPENVVPMPAEQRMELRRLAQAATAGPWTANGPGIYAPAYAVLEEYEKIDVQDAAYIAAVSPDVVLATLAYVEALEAALPATEAPAAAGEAVGLGAERLAAIKAQLEVPRARNSYVTDYGVAADVVEELVDAYDGQGYLLAAAKEALAARDAALAAAEARATKLAHALRSFAGHEPVNAEAYGEALDVAAAVLAAPIELAPHPGFEDAAPLPDLPLPVPAAAPAAAVPVGAGRGEADQAWEQWFTADEPPKSDQTVMVRRGAGTEKQPGYYRKESTVWYSTDGKPLEGVEQWRYLAGK